MERHEKPCGTTEYSCKLQLPCNAPFEKLEGPLCSSMHLAQQVGFFFLHFLFSFQIIVVIFMFWSGNVEEVGSNLEIFLGCWQAVCLAACKKLHEMGAFTDMLLPDKGSGEEGEKVDQMDEGDPLPGTARHREFYPEGVAEILGVGFLA